jgi:hypothetical protein
MSGLGTGQSLAAYFKQATAIHQKDLIFWCCWGQSITSILYSNAW